MIKIYRKTATINAEQFDGSDEMVNKYDIEVVEGDYADDYSMPEAGPAPYFRYFLASGYNEIYIGDWIATGVNGEHWPIADDIFKKTYAELPVIPKAVGEILRSAHGQDNLLGVLETAKNGYKVSEALAWIITNQDTFARAWLDGYQVED